MTGYDSGPRRQEFDGYTYFGVEDGVKNDEDDVSSKDGAGATGGYIEDRRTGKKMWMTADRGLYMLKMWIKTPNSLSF